MKRVALFTVSLSIMLVFAACGGTDNNKHSNNNGNVGGENNTTQEEETNSAGNSDNQALETGNSNESLSKEGIVEVDLENGDEESVGTATLEEVSDGMKITLDGHDIPSGTHAFHIHEAGICEAPDFKSAEGHFNPGDTNHGFDDPDGPHAGDLPNIVVGSDGTVKQSYVAEEVTLEEGEDNSLLSEEGTSLVIHIGADDGKSQPSGDAGDRFACGVIEK